MACYGICFGRLLAGAILALSLLVILCNADTSGSGSSASGVNYCALKENFKCELGDKCIPFPWRCDEELDCSDGSDERNCTPTPCPSSEFLCPANNLCMAVSHRCDGIRDCTDGTDEQGCNSTCAESEFQCKDARCISLAQRCDGPVDCADGSDEEPTLCDETNPSPCGFGMFNCTNGACIPSEYVCDGTTECDDGSDEMYCVVKCKDSEFFCSASNLCVNEIWRCDGEVDCGEGEDEIGCEIEVNCPPHMFDCGGGACISKAQHCDGQIQCPSGLDEYDCNVFPRRCPANQFQCQFMTECIDGSRLCDNVTDCQDTTDEMNCAFTRLFSCDTANGGCEQVCVDTEHSFYCTCRPGFSLNQDGQTCQDIDECAESPGQCSQHCVNTEGSFRCSCQAGYIQLGSRFCRAVGADPAYMVYAGPHGIWRAGFSHTANFATPPVQLIHNQPLITGLDYDLRRNRLYWGDRMRMAIMTSDLTGHDVRVFYRGGVRIPEGVAVDWLTGNVYWIDGEKRTIEVTNSEASFHKILIWTGLDKPRGLVLDPTTRMMYWSDWGEVGRIERASMDGSNRTVVHDTGIHWANAIAIDVPSQTLYWADSLLHSLQASDVSGANRRIVLPHAVNHAYDLALFEDSVFWSDWASKSIRGGNKFVTDKNNPVHVQTVLPFPMGLKVVHPSLQPPATNPCDGGQGGAGPCSQLCLLSSAGGEGAGAGGQRSCDCTLGHVLQPDGRSCKEVDTFLLVAHVTSVLRIPLLDQEGPLFEVQLPLQHVRQAMDVAWDSERDVVFWTDSDRKCISAAQLSGENHRQLYEHDILNPEGITYDWLTKTIYWVDSGYGRIEVADVNGLNRHVLVSTGLQKPRGIAVHPYSGYLYWTDWGDHPKIERINLDGSDRRVVVDLEMNGNKHQANHIAVDVETNRIYWVEYNFARVVYADLNGEGVTTLGVDSSKNHPLGVAVYGDHVYWSSKQMVKRAPKEKRATFEVELVSSDILMAQGIDLFHRDRTFVRTPCSEGNGGCSHLCVSRPMPSGLAASCLCPTGYKLKDDGLNCEQDITKFLLIPDKTTLKTISLDVDPPIHIHIAISGNDNRFDSVDYDPINDSVYWLDKTRKQVLRAPRKGGEPSVVLDRLTEPEGIAVDWLGRKIYSVDTAKKSVDVCTLHGDLCRTVIWKNVDAPKAIALSVKSRRVYWIDWGKNSTDFRVESAFMDGSDRRLLLSQALAPAMWPRALTVDVDGNGEETLFWVDSLTLSGYKFKLSTGAPEVIVSGLTGAGGLHYLEGKLYYSDLYSTKTKGVIKERGPGSRERTLATHLESPQEVKAFDRSIRNVTTLFHMHPCSSAFFTGCSHLCLPSSPAGPKGILEYSQFSCSCPAGLTLEGDGLTCKSVPDEAIVFAKQDSLLRVSMDTKPHSEVTLQAGINIAVDVDFLSVGEPQTTRVDGGAAEGQGSSGKDGYIFWSDYTGSIKRMHMNGSCPNGNCMFYGNLSSPQGIAVDWVTGNVFVVDSGSRSLRVVSGDGRFVKTLVRSDLEEPRGLALDPRNGYLFYSDWGNNPRIVRTNLAGSDPLTMTTNNGKHWPNGMAIDDADNWIYWTDAYQNSIKRTRLDGTAEEPVLIGLDRPFSIDYHSGKLYWSQWNGGGSSPSSIYTVAPYSREEEERKVRIVALNLDSKTIHGIAYVHSDRQKFDASHPCVKENGGCPFFCLMLNPSTWKCGCPDNMPGQCLETYHTIVSQDNTTATPTDQTGATPTDHTGSPVTDRTDDSTATAPSTPSVGSVGSTGTPAPVDTDSTGTTPPPVATTTDPTPRSDSIAPAVPEATIFGMSIGIFAVYIIIAVLSLFIFAVILIICFVTLKMRRQKLEIKSAARLGTSKKAYFTTITPTKVGDGPAELGMTNPSDLSLPSTPTTIASTPGNGRKRPRNTRILSADDISHDSSDIGLDMISVRSSDTRHSGIGRPISRALSLDLLRSDSRDSGMA